MFVDSLQSQTLMTVVQELDKNLFDGYVKPKAAVVMQIARDGILDPNMDWYETPQPSGAIPCHNICPLLAKLKNRQKFAHTCSKS